MLMCVLYSKCQTSYAIHFSLFFRSYMCVGFKTSLNIKLTLVRLPHCRKSLPCEFRQQQCQTLGDRRVVWASSFSAIEVGSLGGFWLFPSDLAGGETSANPQVSPRNPQSAESIRWRQCLQQSSVNTNESRLVIKNMLCYFDSLRFFSAAWRYQQNYCRGVHRPSVVRPSSVSKLRFPGSHCLDPGQVLWLSIRYISTPFVRHTNFYDVFPFR